MDDTHDSFNQVSGLGSEDWIVKRLAWEVIQSLQNNKGDRSTQSLSEPVRKLFISIIIIEIIFMSLLLMISGAFLIQSCRQKQHTARFIIKLLILTVCVSVSGLLKAIHEAPWLQGQSFYNSTTDIVVAGIIAFIYWVAA